MASVSVSATQSTSASVSQTSTATNNGAVSTTLADGSVSLNDQLTASSSATTVGTNLMSHSGFVDTTTNQPVAVVPQQYSGPVSNVQEQFVDVTPDNLNISVSTPNWFIHAGNGNDALAVSSGTNVLDGGTGSNFLTGGSGTDTFFVDDRSATADIWSTVNNFHAGDAVTIWGITPSDFTLSWADGQGASGYTGLTLHATAAGKPTASLTLASFTSADLSDGRLSISYGTSGGSSYMYIHDNS